MARPSGFEPEASASGGHIQLSYGRPTSDAQL